jgi:hypothetical protein
VRFPKHTFVKGFETKRAGEKERENQSKSPEEERDKEGRESMKGIEKLFKSCLFDCTRYHFQYCLYFYFLLQFFSSFPL